MFFKKFKMIQVAQILFILSVLVILHEFGHYLAAKAFKVRVEKFYLFMDAGFSLVKKKIGETEWGIGWLPIGGYVKLAGMVDESMDTEQMAQEPQEWEFRSKPAWQRLIIMLGGIVVNIVLAWVIYTAMYSTVGKKTILTDTFQENGLAFTEVGHKVGFKDGDKILTIDGKKQPIFNRAVVDILLGDQVVVNREGQETTINLTDVHKSQIFATDGKNFIFPQIKAVVDSLVPNSNAAAAGLQRNDVIVQLNAEKTPTTAALQETLAKHKNDSVKISVLRNNAQVTLNALVDKDGKLGFMFKTPNSKDYVVATKYGVGAAFTEAIKESYQMFVYNVKQIKLIFRPQTEAYKQVKSPIGIARILPDTWDWEYVWNFTAMFSIVLAFMNLLPIPGLDGGHALFTIVEMITGKTLSIKAAERVQTFGMIILLTLMALTFGKDIFELVVDKFFK